jgi:hypothetical protein
MGWNWMAVYGKVDKKGNGALNTFLQRAIEKAGFTSRKLTISQKVNPGLAVIG